MASPNYKIFIVLSEINGTQRKEKDSRPTQDIPILVAIVVEGGKLLNLCA
jgi:hypothetical protein